MSDSEGIKDIIREHNIMKNALLIIANGNCPYPGNEACDDICEKCYVTYAISVLSRIGEQNVELKEKLGE
jgi:hypothetical protein